MHTVRLGLYLPYCVDKVRQRVLLTMDGLETATVLEASKLLSFYVQK